MNKEEIVQVTEEVATQEAEFSSDVEDKVSKTDFSSEEVTETETKKQRLERIYTEMAVKHWYESIEHFYVSKKFDIAMKKDWMDKADDYMEKLLRSIASDLWYGSWNKEFVMQNTLPHLSWEKAVMR
jgi:hypothetical protein